MIEINSLGAALGLSFLAFLMLFVGYILYDDWKLHHSKKKTTTKQLHKT